MIAKADSKFQRDYYSPTSFDSPVVGDRNDDFEPRRRPHKKKINFSQFLEVPTMPKLGKVVHKDDEED